MIRFICVVTIIIASLTFSCEKRDRLNGDNNYLHGKWQWERTIYYMDLCDTSNHYQSYMKPDETGTIFELEFKKKGQLIYYENDIAVETYDIKFSSTSNGNGITTSKIFLNGYEELAVDVSWDGSELKYSDFPFKTIPCHIDGNYFTKIN